MDKVDIQILQILESQPRISFSRLAHEVGLSKTPCWQRVKNLEEQAYITGYKSNLNGQKLGFEIQALIFVVIDFNQSEAFEAAITEHHSVMRCSAITGEYDYILEVVARNMSEFDYLLRKDLSRLPGVQRSQTSISTRQVKSSFKFSDLLNKKSRQ